MATTEPKLSGSDDAHSPSENEKHVGNGMPFHVDTVPDPDEGLSEEERKAIVGSRRSHTRLRSLTFFRTVNSSGNWTSNSFHG